MTNEIAASVPRTERVRSLTRFLLDAELDLTCMHTSSVPEEDADVIARTAIAWLDRQEQRV